MNDRLELLRQILTDRPGDDALRLAYADQLELDGFDKAAAVIRVQLELAPHGSNIVLHDDNPNCRCRDCVEFLQLRVNEFCLLNTRIDLPGGWSTGKSDLEPMREWSRLYHPNHILPVARAKWTRGFISELIISWQDWLRHHHLLFWSPWGQQYRSTPDSAMPVEMVRFTTFPADDWRGDTRSRWFRDVGRIWAQACPECRDNPGQGWDGSPQFCYACEGGTRLFYQCHNTWPGMTFQFPKGPLRGASVDFSVQPEEVGG